MAVAPLLERFIEIGQRLAQTQQSDVVPVSVHDDRLDCSIWLKSRLGVPRCCRFWHGVAVAMQVTHERIPQGRFFDPLDQAVVFTVISFEPLGVKRVGDTEQALELAKLHRLEAAALVKETSE